LVGVIASAILFLPGTRELWGEVRGRIVEAQTLVDAYPLRSAAIYFAVYVAVTGLSLPSATMLSVIGGAFFGRWFGTGLALTAATCGATLAFWSSRYLFRNWVMRRFGHRLHGLNAEMERDGPLFLLTLRLMAVFPFFVLNMLLGLTPVRTHTYVGATCLGMLPATFLIVSAGTKIGEVDDPARVLDWQLVACLALAALLPLTLRRLLRRKPTFQGTPDASRA